MGCPEQFPKRHCMLIDGLGTRAKFLNHSVVVYALFNTICFLLFARVDERKKKLSDNCFFSQSMPASASYRNERVRQCCSRDFVYRKPEIGIWFELTVELAGEDYRLNEPQRPFKVYIPTEKSIQYACTIADDSKLLNPSLSFSQSPMTQAKGRGKEFYLLCSFATPATI